MPSFAGYYRLSKIREIHLRILKRALIPVLIQVSSCYVADRPISECDHISRQFHGNSEHREQRVSNFDLQSRTDSDESGDVVPPLPIGGSLRRDRANGWKGPSAS